MIIAVENIPIFLQNGLVVEELIETARNRYKQMAVLLLLTILEIKIKDRQYVRNFV
jgi:hypothetical protein